MSKENLIAVNLRKVDEDIKKATLHMSNAEKAEIARRGMRIVLGIQTEKVVETKVVEKPVTLPKLFVGRSQS